MECESRDALHTIGRSDDRSYPLGDLHIATDAATKTAAGVRLWPPKITLASGAGGGEEAYTRTSVSLPLGGPRKAALCESVHDQSARIGS